MIGRGPQTLPSLNMIPFKAPKAHCVHKEVYIRLSLCLPTVRLVKKVMKIKEYSYVYITVIILYSDTGIENILTVTQNKVRTKQSMCVI